MYFPKTLDVRGTKYKVRIVDQPFDEKGEPVNGTCCGMRKEIEIIKDLPPTIVLEIFLHEYVHAVWFEMGIDEEDIPVWVEHIIIAGVSKDLVNNREIFQKVLASCKKAA